MAENALAQFANKYDLVGPTVDDDVRRIIARWGAEAVKASVKEQTKPKRGRKPEKDWPLLWPYIERDAREWLAGGDPFSKWSDYSIAKDYADANPGQSHPATMKRIIGRLKTSRKSFTIIEAHRLSREGYPFAAHLRALEEMAKLNRHPVWAGEYARARQVIADYRSKYGAMPPDKLSMFEVEFEARKPLPKAEGAQYVGLLEQILKPLGGAQ